jgi:hypothetical protein
MTRRTYASRPLQSILCATMVACAGAGSGRDADATWELPDTATDDVPDAPGADEDAGPDLAADPVEAGDTPIELPPPDRPPCPAPADAPALTIHVDPAGPGRTFDGLGAISSAGNSRLLIDYPEPERSRILDFLFKPGAGLALQVLKVEIPGDMNSTSGSEASHMHSADDLDCHRGYEWWLMKEAKARNPGILLAALPWGSPAWTGAPTTFYTPELIEYLLAWLDCAGENGLAIDYLGGRNETFWDLAWIVALKAAMTAHGTQAKLVMADTHQTTGWLFAMLLAGDATTAAAVDVVGVHYPCFYDSNDATVCDAPPEVLGLDKPLWASEQGGDPASFPRILTRGYADARLTAFHLWPMLGALPEGLPFQDSGLVVAREPWSGSFRVAQLAWTFMHVTQSTAVGWRYIDDASGRLGDDRAAGAYATLVSPDGTLATTLIETTNASEARVAELEYAEGMPKRPVHVWVTDTASSKPGDALVHECDLDPASGPVRLALAPGRFYTLTTTGAPVRGDTTSPAPSPFPLPYVNDFDSETPGQEARWLASGNGAWEVVQCGGGRTGRCVRQVVTEKPKFWGPQVSDPFAVIGDGSLKDYAVRVDAMPESDGVVEVLGRYFNQEYFNPRLWEGYALRVGTSGDWSIERHDKSSEAGVVLASGTTAAWPIGTWRTVELSLDGPTLGASLEGVELGTVTDVTWTRGLAGVALSGADADAAWFPVQLDNLSILPIVK